MPASLIFANCQYKLALPHGRGLIFINLDQVLYFSSDNIYCKMHLVDGTIKTILASIKELECSLCNQHFIRIHKQFIVNLAKVDMYSKADGGFLLIAEQRLPLSRMRRKGFLERISEE